MLIVIAFIIGLVGGWVYAGCPLPRSVPGVLSSRRPLPAERPASDGSLGKVAVSPAPAPGASPGRP
jgi:hypothetical protein